MAKDNEASKAAADKGKAKAVDAKTPDAAKDKDGKPVANGKKDDKKDEKPESESSPSESDAHVMRHSRHRNDRNDGWTSLTSCASQPRSLVRRTSN